MTSLRISFWLKCVVWKGAFGKSWFYEKFHPNAYLGMNICPMRQKYPRLIYLPVLLNCSLLPSGKGPSLPL